MSSNTTPSKKPLVLIIVIFILPMLLAGAYFFWLNPENIRTTNVGTLLKPPAQKTDWVESAPSTERHWQIVLVHPNACDQACETHLARLASIQQALQKDIPRTEVVLWTNADTKPQLPGVKMEHLRSASQNSSFVIADPLGNIILKYELSADTSGIFRDLKKLLKGSQIG